MRVLLSIITLLIVCAANAQDTTHYERQVFTRGNDSLLYRIQYPSRYDVNKQYPVVLFLHGAGERGSDNEAQLEHGGSRFADSANRVRFPAFVIFPQCPQQSYWANIIRQPNTDSLGNFIFRSEGPPTPAQQLVMGLMDSLVATPQVDPQRLYVGGLSMGGMGTFELLWRKPGFFAAAFAICGGGDPRKVATYARNFPIWVFHGDADDVVPVGNSRLMVNTLKMSGAKVRYTEYKGVGHDSWTNTFAEKDLIPWLFAQKSANASKKATAGPAVR